MYKFGISGANSIRLERFQSFLINRNVWDE